MSSTIGIDVSGNNGTIDWEKVANSHVEFVYLKVNEGDWLDGTTRNNARAAHHTDLLVGGYDFARPRSGRSGLQEFDIFQERATALGLLGSRSLRPVIDIEVTKLTAAGTRSYVWSWVKRCHERVGCYPFIYTGKWFWDGVMHARKPSHCPLWLAAYTTGWKKLIPVSFNKGVSIHQYSDKGWVPGIHGHVDMDKYLSSKQNLIDRHTIGNAKRHGT